MNFNSRAASLFVSFGLVFVLDVLCTSSVPWLKNVRAFFLLAQGYGCWVMHLWIQELRQGGGYLLVSTDIAARGIDLPETTHIYNFDLPRTAIDYLHRAGRTGRKPFSDEKCVVTSIITSEEHFVLQRYENELKFDCEEISLQAHC